MEKLFNELVKIVESHTYYIDGCEKELLLDSNMMAETKMYRTHFDTFQCSKGLSKIIVINDDCLKVAKEQATIFKESLSILNLASYRNPCGSVIYGEGAQEEYISLCSDYYRSLFQFTHNPLVYGKYNVPVRADEYYPIDLNWGGIYSSNVTFFRERVADGQYKNIHAWKCNVIAVPALSEPKCVEVAGELLLSDESIAIVKNKIRTIFNIAVDNNQKCLVLSAWGCGAYKNPPKHIARLFKEILMDFSFEKVIFAIKDPTNVNYNVFAEIFSDV